LDTATISALVAAGGIVVGLVLTVLQLRDPVKTRQTDLAMRLHACMPHEKIVFNIAWLIGFEYVLSLPLKLVLRRFLSIYHKYSSFLEIELYSRFFISLSCKNRGRTQKISYF
jgi:hypothetical protein